MYLLNHKNLKYFMKSYFNANLERFTKFLNHETLELYGTFTSKMPFNSEDFLHKDMTVLSLRVFTRPLADGFAPFG